VQLATADEDRADLGQLAGGAGTAVGLDVYREEFRFRGWCGKQIQGRAFYARTQTERLFALSPAARPAG
jgi:hypothetical protein